MMMMMMMLLLLLLLLMMLKMMMTMMMMMISGSRWLQGTDQCKQARRIRNLRPRPGAVLSLAGGETHK